MYLKFAIGNVRRSVYNYSTCFVALVFAVRLRDAARGSATVLRNTVHGRARARRIRPVPGGVSRVPFQITSFALIVVGVLGFTGGDGDLLPPDLSRASACCSARSFRRHKVSVGLIGGRASLTLRVASYSEERKALDES